MIAAAVIPYEERIAALVPAALEQVLKEKLNPVEKSDLRRRLLDSIVELRVGELVRETAEEGASRRARNDDHWARIKALEQVGEVNDLTPERRTYLRARAVEHLGRLGFLDRMADQLSDWESGDAEEEGATLKRAKRSAREALEEVSDYLSYALTDDEISHLKACYSMWMRSRRRRYRAGVRSENGDYYTRPARLLSMPLNVPKLGRQEFSRLVESCDTQRDVVALFACWGVEARRERIDGVTVIVGGNAEVWPV